MTETGPTVRWTSAADVFKLPPDVFEFFLSQPSGVGLNPGEQLGCGEVDIPSGTVVSLAPGKDLGLTA